MRDALVIDGPRNEYLKTATPNHAFSVLVWFGSANEQGAGGVTFGGTSDFTSMRNYQRQNAINYRDQGTSNTSED